MPPDILAFLLFALATSITPGPNNIMVAAAAANGGWRATVPMVLGINAGFALMLAIVGLGLAGPLAAMPSLHTALRWVGGIWMLWIAWTILRAAPPDSDAPGHRPLGFRGAALFQWANPKAWVIAVATTATYTAPDRSLLSQVIVLSVCYALVGLPSTSTWAVLGAGTGRLLRSPGRLQAFNAAMAGLLVLSIVPMLIG